MKKYIFLIQNNVYIFLCTHLIKPCIDVQYFVSKSWGVYLSSGQWKYIHHYYQRIVLSFLSNRQEWFNRNDKTILRQFFDNSVTILRQFFDNSLTILWQFFDNSFLENIYIIIIKELSCHFCRFDRNDWTGMTRQFFDNNDVCNSLTILWQFFSWKRKILGGEDS